MNDIIEKLLDLHTQATKERSHYYVASTVQEAADCILSLRTELAALQNIIKISDERLIAAAKKASITYMGCDTPDALADEIVELREKAKGIEKVHALINSDFKNCFNSKEIDILKSNAIKMWKAIKNFAEGK